MKFSDKHIAELQAMIQQAKKMQTRLGEIQAGYEDCSDKDFAINAGDALDPFLNAMVEFT